MYIQYHKYNLQIKKKKLYKYTIPPHKKYDYYKLHNYTIVHPTHKTHILKNIKNLYI